MKRVGHLFDTMTSFDHLLASARRAARGKRHRPGVAGFLFRLERLVLHLQAGLRDRTWAPGGYREFIVHEPKRRLISAAPFADRVVHHALVGVLEPVFEPTFIFDSYACRNGRGTHRAVERYQAWSRSSRYFLKMDVQKFFPSVDHALLQEILARKIKDPGILALVRRIVEGSNPQEPAVFYFPGDELFTPLDRRRGLPIGNQTSQFFSNVYLNPLDHYVKDTLRVPRYLRYVDDLVVMGDSRRELHRLRERIEEFCWGLRLRFNPIKCYVAPVDQGLRLLGYRVFPHRIRLALPIPHKNPPCTCIVDAGVVAGRSAEGG